MIRTPALDSHAICMHTEGMRALQIRNVPDDIHESLQRRAAAANQSLQEYLLQLVTEHTRRPTVKEWVAQLRAMPPGPDIPMADIIQAFRDEREERDKRADEWL